MRENSIGICKICKIARRGSSDRSVWPRQGSVDGAEGHRSIGQRVSAWRALGRLGFSDEHAGGRRNRSAGRHAFVPADASRSRVSLRLRKLSRRRGAVHRKTGRPVECSKPLSQVRCAIVAQFTIRHACLWTMPKGTRGACGFRANRVSLGPYCLEKKESVRK